MASYFKVCRILPGNKEVEKSAAYRNHFLITVFEAWEFQLVLGDSDHSLTIHLAAQSHGTADVDNVHAQNALLTVT